MCDRRGRPITGITEYATLPTTQHQGQSALSSALFPQRTCRRVQELAGSCAYLKGIARWCGCASCSHRGLARGFLVLTVASLQLPFHECHEQPVLATADYALALSASSALFCLGYL